ncbi:CHAP domain-containing protein [Candidatus Saccharibacteria bacterium]|nr:CHAP domain-containing protein [Candidatus Saccharibacteria bacterium]
MIKINIRNILMSGAVFGMMVSLIVGTVINNIEVNGISKACQNSAACREAVAKEEEANKNAAAASNSADYFQMKVSELSMEISSRESEIVQTEVQIKELKKQIYQTQLKLEEEQEALAELLINMHFEGDSEPIQILAGSSSISDLAEKAAREEVVKQQISVSAVAVRSAKQQLEDDKAEVEELLASQQAAKEALVAKRGEQQNLVEKYQNDAEAYAEVAKAAQEAQRAAEKAEQEAHPELYRGSAYTGANTYPWQEDCPAKQDWYGTVWDGYYIGGYVCECVSYTGWKAYEAYGVVLAWGNAYSWDDRARAAGYTVDHTPAAGTIGQVDGGAYGHVFWVESVNGDGSINVTEYNNSYATYLYSGDSHFGDFGARTIGAGEVGRYNYIHL